MNEATSARATASAELPPWLRSSAVAWFGALLASVVIALTAAFLMHGKSVVEQAELQSAELYARILQDHAERTFDTVDIALAALAENLAGGDADLTAATVSPQLVRALAGLPFLRSLSLMNGAGLVLASSTPANLGTRVDLRQVPLPGSGALDALGASVAGRDLVDVGAMRGAAVAGGAHSFVPLVRRVGNASGEPLFMAAALNPDFFANAHELVLADPSRSAALVALGRVVLSAAGSTKKQPGERIDGHRFFTDFMPARESGQAIGPGLDGETVFAAFRTLRKRPLVIVVERRIETAMAPFQRIAYATVGVGLASVLVIGALVVMAWRSLRGHEAVRVALDATRAEVTESERDLRELVESVHELIFSADAQGRITFVNGRWQQLTGRPPSELLGQRFASLCPAGERDACDALFATQGGGDDSVRVSVRDARGRGVALELSVSRLTGPRSASISFVGFAVDITEREAARRALESQLKFTAQLLEVSPTPLFVKDVNGRFSTVNRAWLELMGMTLPQVLGRRSDDLYGEDAPKHNEHDARLLISEERLSYENRLHVLGRPPRDTVVTKVRFTTADGTPAGIVGSIIDVTEFREAERRILEAHDVAAMANGAKSEFIANVSHELRTPLQAILGFAGLGIEATAESPDMQELFDEIQAGGQRMLTLVNALLDVSQMESAVGSLTLQRGDVAHHVRQAVLQLRSAAVRRDQSVRLVGLSAAWFADIDPTRFQQAVRNVLANAVRFGPVGSVIDIECSVAAGSLVLTLRDHGPGIPEDELETIFESFVQSSRTRDGSGGAGLGLTIARKIMSAHGGSVVAGNAAGGGAVLRLTLPMPADDAAPDDRSLAHPVDVAIHVSEES